MSVSLLPLGFMDVDGPLLGGGAFYQGVLEDSIHRVHLLVLDKGVARVFVQGLGRLCALIPEDSPGLRMNSQRCPSLTRF